MRGDSRKDNGEDEKRQRNLFARRNGPGTAFLALLLSVSLFVVYKFAVPRGLKDLGGRSRLGALGNNDLVDIDIGTLGRAMGSNASLLVSFDPGDEPLKTGRLERYKFVIADRTGPTQFYVNDAAPGCSSLHRRNEEYNKTIHEAGLRKRCRVGRKQFESGALWNCMHAPLRSIRVQAMLLSTFVQRRGIGRIGTLKIDAQGSDFAILKDFIEHCPDVSFDRLIIECQVYRDVPPLYFADNDCDDAQAYMEEKFPGISVKRAMNNCMAHEYNMEFRKMMDHKQKKQAWRDMFIS